ncbi:MAG: YggW family oxidoreductase [Legionellaceae bacterium]|nr:YggW family oxidoreductase [Legionellaceae bacterium]
MLNPFVIPLALYVHIPWCVRKCPYCDFNSHRAGKVLPEEAYIKQLLADLKHDKAWVQGRAIESIFIGGGTPSLFSAEGMAELLHCLHNEITVANHAEITMEANPGTVEQRKFNGFRQAGINRLSIGVQSFQDEKLKRLGRIHCANEAENAIHIAKKAGFNNINIDLMHGLPNQSKQDALYDLEKAMSLAPQHLSWYQLTLEPNTVFAKHPPVLPQEDSLWAIQEAGEACLAKQGYQQYEVSAYAKPGLKCRHNLNYWQFGDYLAIGAGAHGKITQTDGIYRYSKHRNPRDYLQADDLVAEQTSISTQALPLEFMMNALRLVEGVPVELFSARTGMALSEVENALDQAKTQGLLADSDRLIKPTKKGLRFLNDVLLLF